MLNSFKLVVMEVTCLARSHSLGFAIFAPTKYAIFQGASHTLVVFTEPKLTTSLWQLTLTFIKRISVKESVSYLPDPVAHVQEVSVKLNVTINSKPEICYGAVVHWPAKDTKATSF
ncbi:hypothetical protein L6164_018362 [Bauhinia variegata]|uniref:Uncharacterized protein n=1 Tax=Bauhinia variegata TaxID=167791 RepID=A0ACB9NFS3_BAUVA|nr:hypothetical protein L6164_018362 [Bauhinia variegata]